MMKLSSKKECTRFKRYLQQIQKLDWESKLTQYAEEGVEALRYNTPVDTGVTAGSWRYEIEYDPNKHVMIKWINDNLTHYGAPVVILLQYGHATKSGGYVQGQDFINPAMKPVFDKIENEIHKEVRNI